jgi:hypothetical protein
MHCAQRFTPLLVKLLNRVARDHASPGGLVLDPTRQPLAHARCVSRLCVTGYRYTLHVACRM